MNSREQAVQKARSWLGSIYGRGRCLAFVDTCYEEHRGHDAADEWQATRERGQGAAPYGVPVWWLGGQHGYGHVAISNGDGNCYTTDFAADGYQGDGRVHLCPIDSIAAHDPLLHYVGWSQDIAGQHIPEEDFDMTPEQVQAAFEKALASFFAKHWAQMVAAAAGHSNAFITNAPGAPNMHLKTDA